MPNSSRKKTVKTQKKGNLAPELLCDRCKKKLTDHEQAMMYLIPARPGEKPGDTIVDGTIQVCWACFKDN